MQAYCTYAGFFDTEQNGLGAISSDGIILYQTQHLLNMCNPRLLLLPVLIISG